MTFKLNNGWLKDQMKKAAEEVENWQDWMKKLDRIESIMEAQTRKQEAETYAERLRKKSLGML